MKFEEALKAMREGKKVRCNHWSNKECYLIIKNDRIVNDSDDKAHLLTTDDILQTDWELYERHISDETFTELLEFAGVNIPDNMKIGDVTIKNGEMTFTVTIYLTYFKRGD